MAGWPAGKYANRPVGTLRVLVKRCQPLPGSLSCDLPTVDATFRWSKRRGGQGFRLELPETVLPLAPLEIDPPTAARAFGDAYFNLLRRGADGSLVLSRDQWRLEEATRDAFRFSAREEDGPPLEVRLEDVERLVWDRLPRQQVRSQIRFVLVSGDLWTFSGTVDESALPDRTAAP